MRLSLTTSFTGRTCRPLVAASKRNRVQQTPPGLHIFNIASSQLPRSNNSGAVPRKMVRTVFQCLDGRALPHVTMH